MTREQYLQKLDRIVGTLSKVTEKAKEPRDHIEILKLQFDIITKIYECTKEE